VDNHTLPELVVSPIPSDVSDHNMLLATINRRAYHMTEPQVPPTLRWRLENLDIAESRLQYQEAVAAKSSDFMSVIAGAQASIKSLTSNLSITQEERHSQVKSHITQVAENLERLLIGAAEDKIGAKRVCKGLTKPHWDKEVQEEWQKMRQLHKDYLAQTKLTGHGPAATHKFEQYIKQRDLKNRLIKSKIFLRSQQLVERLNAAHQPTNRKTPTGAKELWAQVNRHTNSAQATRVSAIRDGDGILQHSAEGKAKAMGHFYRKLTDVEEYAAHGSFADHAAFHTQVQTEVATYPALSHEPSNTGMAPLNVDVTEAEVKIVLKSLANRKSGSQNSRLVNELLKYSGDCGVTILTALLNLMWNNEIKPDHFKLGFIVSVHKKGPTDDPGNYRPLTMLHCIGKVYSRIINTRLMAACESNGILHDAQNGFRRGRRCEDHLLTLRQTLAARKCENKSTFLYGTDVYKAYDTVWRDGLFHRLWAVGIRGKMWRILKDMYTNTRSVATWEGSTSAEGEFNVDMGLAQGDPLSPTLFAIFINPLLDAIEERCTGVPLGDSGVVLRSLLFADDQLGLSSTAADTETVIQTIDGYCGRWKIRLNKSKCWVLVVGPEEVNYAHLKHWGNSEIELVQKALYLGGTLDSKLRRDTHAEHLLEKATTKANQLTKFFINTKINAGLRQLVLDTLIKPTLEWGTEVWPPTAKTAAKMQSLYTKVQRQITRCHRGTSAAIVRAEMGSRSLSSWQKQQQLSYCQHLHLMPEGRLTKVAASAWPECRSTLMWHKTEKNLFKQLEITPEFMDMQAPPSFKSRSNALLQQHDVGILQELANKKRMLKRYLTLIDVQQPRNMQEYLAGPTDKGATLLLLCRAGALLTNEHTQRWTTTDTDDEADETNNHCPSCNTASTETISHILFDCLAYQNLTAGRAAFEAKIANLLTPEQLVQWQNFTPESIKETSLLGDRWLGGSTTQLQPALKQFLNVAWTARQAKINQAVAPEQDDPTGELSSAIDGPSRTLALNLPAQAVRLGEPNPMARPALLDPSSTGHPGTTALDGMTAAAHHTNARRSSLRSHGKKAGPTIHNSECTHLCLATAARTTTRTSSELGARLNPNQTGSSTFVTALPHGRVANGSDAKA
jgi:hypothetical protein